MPDYDHSKTYSEDIRCAGCGYELRGLDQVDRCPECGTLVSESISLASEVHQPRRKIPRLKQAYVLITLATLAGAPALFLYAVLTLIEKTLDPLALERITHLALPILFTAGTALPVATIASVPRDIRPHLSLLTVTIFLVATLLGVVLMILGGPHVFTIGAGLGAIGCIMNLTMATRVIGSVVPRWRRLGGARQSGAPLLATVAVILLGRFFLPAKGGTLTNLQYLFVLGGETLLIGAEALLGIGALYLLVNRLWLAERLRRSITRNDS
jgi:hypothetical protein